MNTVLCSAYPPRIRIRDFERFLRFYRFVKSIS
jgi:hypothetical protein